MKRRHRRIQNENAPSKPNVPPDISNQTRQKQSYGCGKTLHHNSIHGWSLMQSHYCSMSDVSLIYGPPEDEITSAGTDDISNSTTVMSTMWMTSQKSKTSISRHRWYSERATHSEPANHKAAKWVNLQNTNLPIDHWSQLESNIHEYLHNWK